MLTKTQLQTMLRLQDFMNTTVNSEWKTANNDWYLAAALEIAEAIEHHGWKWWKHQECDLAQVQMELVDVWHFILSNFLIDHSLDSKYLTYTEYSYSVFNNKSYKFLDNDLLQNLKLLMSMLSSNYFCSSLFFHICKQAKLPSEDLYKQYLGKNVLNFFRQNNGYKKGTYKKTWFDSREDNEHLVDVLKVVNIHVENADKQIYSMLSDLYDKNY